MAPDQSKAIMQMPTPETKKKIQALIGKLVALNRFISRYSDRLWPFFTALKGASLGSGDRSLTRIFMLLKYTSPHP